MERTEARELALASSHCGRNGNLWCCECCCGVERRSQSATASPQPIGADRTPSTTHPSDVAPQGVVRGVDGSRRIGEVQVQEPFYLQPTDAVPAATHTLHLFDRIPAHKVSLSVTQCECQQRHSASHSVSVSSVTWHAHLDRKSSVPRGKCSRSRCAWLFVEQICSLAYETRMVPVHVANESIS
jgi:hypothetical protein